MRAERRMETVRGSSFGKAREQSPGNPPPRTRSRLGDPAIFLVFPRDTYQNVNIPVARIGLGSNLGCIPTRSFLSGLIHVDLILRLPVWRGKTSPTKPLFVLRGLRPGPGPIRRADESIGIQITFATFSARLLPFRSETLGCAHRGSLS